MTPAQLEDFRVLVVPGLHGSGPGHWQTRWEHLFPWFERVEQETWDVPDLHVWSTRVGEALRQSSRPTLIIAHSFGCLATIHRASIEASHLAGTLLVAPADPGRFGVEELLRHRRMPCPSVVVGSLDDPWMEARRAARWADEWGCGLISAGAVGHINADSGLGDWEFGLRLLPLLAKRWHSTSLSPYIDEPDVQSNNA